MRFVLDASVALAWAFEDEGDAWAVSVLRSLGSGEAVVAGHWGLEVANGLLMAQRRERIDAAGATEFATRLLALPIVVDPVARSRAFRTTTSLARSHGLTAYDAAYLELALRLGLSLATLDRALADAGEREGVVRYEPEAVR